MNTEAYFKIKDELGTNVQLIAVSKKQDIEKIQSLIKLGQKDFGENYVQDLTNRYELLNLISLNWHFIGHLQSNKVKFIAPFVELIHSVDSFNLLKIINKEAAKQNRIINCLLQIYIAKEESKFGLEQHECYSLLQNEELDTLKNIKINGLMGMASFTDDLKIVQKEFRFLKKLFDSLKSDFFSNRDEFNTLSMGMSDDYKIAVDEGSNMVRIGSLIFGERKY